MNHPREEVSFILSFLFSTSLTLCYLSHHKYSFKSKVDYLGCGFYFIFPSFVSAPHLSLLYFITCPSPLRTILSSWLNYENANYGPPKLFECYPIPPIRLSALEHVYCP